MFCIEIKQKLLLTSSCSSHVLTDIYEEMDFLGDLDRLDNRGYTPLHYAADHSLLENVRLLLGYGAEADMKSTVVGHEVRN